MSAVKGLFGSFESEPDPKREEEHESDVAMSPIVNTPAGYPGIAPKASTPLPSPKRAKLSSLLETVPDTVVDTEVIINETLSTTVSGSGQTLPSISFDISQNPTGLPNCDPKQSQTGICPQNPKATVTLAHTDHAYESARAAISLKLLYINLIKELHGLLVCGAIS